MRHRELMRKVGERKMNTSRKDEGTIADNVDMEVQILQLSNTWLLIPTNNENSRVAWHKQPCYYRWLRIE